MRIILPAFLLALQGASDKAPPPNQHLPFRELFNGRDLAGWKADEEAKKHWTAKDGVLCFDGKGKSLWTEGEYGDCCLYVAWRLPSEPVEKARPMILPEGTEELDDDGKPVTRKVQDAGESGVFIRGSEKAEVNIWCWPVGSGEIHGYRIDKASSPELRRACTPLKKADREGFNDLYISVKGEHVVVELNGVIVVDNPRLTGLPARGPIGLQAQGSPVEFKRVGVFEYRNRR
jgi:hypothetical protein